MRVDEGGILRTDEGDEIRGWLLVQVGVHPSGRYADVDGGRAASTRADDAETGVLSTIPPLAMGRTEVSQM